MSELDYWEKRALKAETELVQVGHRLGGLLERIDKLERQMRIFRHMDEERRTIRPFRIVKSGGGDEEA